MTYLLELFNDIVHGEMNPVNGTGFRKLKAAKELQQLYGEYREHFIVPFEDKGSGKYKITGHKAYAFAELAMIPLPDEVDFDKDPAILDKLKSIAATELSLDGRELKDPKYQKIKDLICLHFEIEYDWPELSVPKARYHYLNHLLIKEVDKVKADLSRNIFSFSNEEAIRLFVRNHQSELILLIENCLYRIKTRGKEKSYRISNRYTTSDVLKLTFYYLENLLIYLEHHFSNYLDLKRKIPYRHKMITIYELKPAVDKLLGEVDHSVNHPLTEIVFEPLNKLLDINISLNYQQLIYLKDFAGKFQRQLQERDFILNDESLVRFLESMNFNSLRFIQYLINSFNQEINKIRTLEKRQLFLHDLMRRYSRVPIANEPYIDNLPPLKDQMLNWINEELDLICRNYDNNYSGPAKPQPAPERKKLPFNLSVAQMAYLMKVEKELGIFPTNNLSEIMRIFCENTSSIRQENISLSSMWSKYYNVEHSTKLAMRSIVKKMLDYINKDIDQ